MLTLTLAFGAVFIIGFLLGERRSLRQCNEILDHNTKALLGAIRDEPTIPVADEEPATFPTATVH